VIFSSGELPQHSWHRHQCLLTVHRLGATRVHSHSPERPPHMYFHLSEHVFPVASHLTTPGVEIFHLWLDTPVFSICIPPGHMCILSICILEVDRLSKRNPIRHHSTKRLSYLKIQMLNDNSLETLYSSQKIMVSNWSVFGKSSWIMN